MNVLQLSLLLCAATLATGSIAAQYTLSGGVAYGGTFIGKTFVVREIRNNGEGWHSSTTNRKIYEIYGVYIGADWRVEEDWKLQAGLGWQRGSIPELTVWDSEDLMRIPVTFEEAWTREMGATWLHLLLQRRLMGRRSDSRLWIGTGLTAITYWQDYLAEVVENQRIGIITERTYKKERHSGWGWPVQLAYRGEITPQWGLEAKWTLAFLQTKNVQSVLQVGATYTIAGRNGG